MGLLGSVVIGAGLSGIFITLSPDLFLLNDSYLNKVFYFFTPLLANVFENDYPFFFFKIFLGSSGSLSYL